MQIVDEINFLELRYLIGFKSSFLFTSIIANKIRTLIAPTYTSTCAAATKLAFNNKYKPATLINTPPNKKAEYTILSNKTTPNEPTIIIKDNIEKQINCVVTAIDMYLIYFPTGTSSVDFEDTIQSNTSSGNFPTLGSDDGTS